MLYIFIKELGKKKVGDKVNMNLNINSPLLVNGYLKKYVAEEVVEAVSTEEVIEEAPKKATRKPKSK